MARVAAATAVVKCHLGARRGVECVPVCVPVCIPRAALSGGQAGTGPGREKASSVPAEALMLWGCRLSSLSSWWLAATAAS